MKMLNILGLTLLSILVGACSGVASNKVVINAPGVNSRGNFPVVKNKNINRIFSLYNLQDNSSKTLYNPKSLSGYKVQNISHKVNYDDKNNVKLEKNIISKVNKLYSVLNNLDKNHKILTNKDLIKLRANNPRLITCAGDNNLSNYINQLVELDSIAANIPLITPMPDGNITSYYGSRYNPVTKKSRVHKGLDIQGKKYAAVYATANGIISKIDVSRGYGKLIEINHGNKVTTRYAHLSKYLVKQGDKVLRGQVIGLQGRTGRCTNDHLHFEILVNNKPVDPLNMLVDIAPNKPVKKNKISIFAQNKK